MSESSSSEPPTPKFTEGTSPKAKSDDHNMTYIIIGIVILIILVLIGLWWWYKYKKIVSLNSSTNSTLLSGQCLSSPSGASKLKVSGGKLAVTTNGSISSNSSSNTVVTAKLNSNGMLCIQDASGNELGTFGTGGNAGPYTLTLTDGGILTITDGANNANMIQLN